jgi:hypothetical protein
VKQPSLCKYPAGRVLTFAIAHVYLNERKGNTCAHTHTHTRALTRIGKEGERVSKGNETDNA